MTRVNPSDVILLVPLGVDPQIYHWGVSNIKDYIETQYDNELARIWNFSRDKFINKEIIENKIVITQTFKRLDGNLKSLLMGNVSYQYSVYSLILVYGDKLLDVLARNRAIKVQSKKTQKSLVAAYSAMKSRGDLYFQNKLKEFGSTTKEKKNIWGISVYDRTAFHSLYLAEQIKQIDPEGIVLLGGEYFSLSAAIKVFKGANYIDGIVVGFGEKVYDSIVSHIHSGGKLESVSIKGLVNQTFINTGATDLSDYDTEFIHIPKEYTRNQQQTKISFIKETSYHHINILSQRGCYYGKCSFCTQILDQHYCFRVSNEVIISELEVLLGGCIKNGDPLTIRFDSDEIPAELLISVVQLLNRMNLNGTLVNVTFWFQIKSFKKSIGEVIAQSKNLQQTKYHFSINIESLNSKTLKDMKKGHTPFKAIEAIKSLIDCGVNYSSLYFMYFPLESEESVKDEVGILERILHLLQTRSNGGIRIIYYAANNRDQLFHNQSKYKIKVNRNPMDFIIRDKFKIDLEYSYWGYIYREFFTGTWKTVLMKIQKKALMEVEKDGFKSSVKFQIYDFLFYAISFLLNKKAFYRRFRVSTYLSKCLKEDKDTIRERGRDSAATSCYNIHGHRLVKNYQNGNDSRRFDILLSHLELSLLRFLYFRKTRKEIINQFSQYHSKEIDGLLDKHIKLNSIINIGSLYLSVVNDRQYWHEPTGAKRDLKKHQTEELTV